MKDVYDFKNIEKKWQETWRKQKVFAAKPNDPRPRYYCLEMFPYPSGNLHMGHVRNYSIGDVVARTHRMKGKNVLHPIGWDAFGLPAENAAIKNKVHPEKWTRQNIAAMRGQLQALGISYDWDREFATCDTEYYRWNQWFFLKFYEKGLVYKKKAAVNWCPSCQTVMANEQVSASGQCWRCDFTVEAKELEQWFIKITVYAEQLLKDNALLKGKWPNEVLVMQEHWIGRSDGAEVQFGVEGRTKKLTIFTTRPDTLFGATYMALAPEHPLARELAERNGTIQELNTLAASQRANKRDRQESADKNGFFLDAYAINPVNNQRIPIWVADYVLLEYGTGAIMAVPAHDQRDFDFATKYRMFINQVIQPHEQPLALPLTQAYEGEGVLINSGEFNGIPSTESKRKVAEWLEKRGTGKATVTYKLRDWLVSRQRYWGTPIPMISCPDCGIVPVPEKDLPVLLPTDVEFTGKGESPLATSASFQQVKCPTCHGNARRETDTMDTFVDSSWYYARYSDPRNNQNPFDAATVNPWLPVNQYIGGIEHATMHLIYSRFWHKAMRDLGLVQSPEPFERLLAQGMVTLGGSAMSKSRGNVVDPNAIIEKFGADTARLFILFAAPPEKQLEWSDTGVEGAWRFLNRVWRLVDNFLEKKKTGPAPVVEEKTKALRRKTHWAIAKVDRDYSKEIQINTAIAAVMELVNVLYVYDALGDCASEEAVQTVIQLLSPVAPHLMEELWESLGRSGRASESAWPAADPQWLEAETVEIVVQINGKLRDRIQIAPGTPNESLEKAVLALPKIHAGLDGKTVVKVIVVPDKLVNIVAR
ncbi:MAG: leucine--tRNA ligase [Elusimicrobiota bacterium]|jgi:leucyl-tRNA synthetase